MKYSQFEIDIFDEDNDANHKDSLLGPVNGLDKLLIQYEPSSIPSIELVLSVKFPLKYMNLKNIYISVSNEHMNIEYNVGIIDSVIKGETITLYGYLCKYDDFNLINSSYLGDTFINCVKALDSRKLMKASSEGEVIEFKEDFSFDYWKIQESNIQSLHHILQLAAKESIYSMDNENIYINKIDFSNSKATHESLPPKEVLYISRSDRIKDLLTDEESNKSLIFNNDEKSNFSINTSMGKFLIGKKDDTALINHIYSLPYITYLGDFLIKVLYDQTYIPFHIGESMEAIDGDYGTTSNWYIISKVERFTKKGMQTAILFSCN